MWKVVRQVLWFPASHLLASISSLVKNQSFSSTYLQIKNAPSSLAKPLSIPIDSFGKINTTRNSTKEVSCFVFLFLSQTILMFLTLERNLVVKYS